MKKFLLLAVMAMFFISCTSEGGLDVKACWEFSIKTTVTMAGQSSTATGTVEKCDLTEAEANNYMKELTTTVTSSSGGYTMTSKTVCTGKTKK